MVLAGMWLADRRRKYRAKCYEEAYARARAAGCTDGFDKAWTWGYEEGHRRAYAMGYDENRAEGYAIALADARASVRSLWLAWLGRRKEAEARGDDFTEPPPHLTDRH